MSLTFWVTGIVFVLVNLFMAYCVLRYRHGKVKGAHYEPENKKLEGWLIGITSVGVAAMLAPGLFAWAKFVDVPKDASAFEVVGRQWNFNYRFPGADGVLGTVDARFVSDANPFGINPDDPHGQDDILVASPELHLPIGKPIKADLRSIDVLHDFTVPQFRAKMNMVPGLVTYVWYTPTRAGTYDVFCEQLCGIAHYAMRGKVVVEDETAFKAWLGAYPTFAQIVGARRRRCRRGRAALRGLRRLPWRAGRGQSRAERAEIERAGGLVPEAAAAALQERRARRAREGCLRQDDGADGGDADGRSRHQQRRRLHQDASGQARRADREGQCQERARRLTRTARACHGADGRGIQATNAPRLKGMSDWYSSPN